MPIQVLECPSCAGFIDFYDETKLFGRCSSCGREVQRTEPAKIIIQGNYDDSNQVIKQGMDHLDLEHFELAEDLFRRYIEKNPKRYEGYYGMLLSATRNFDPKSLDSADVSILPTIESHMRDVSKTADSDTVALIRERLDQFYVDYKEYALKEINNQIDENEKECDELEERIDRDRREMKIDSIRSNLKDAKEKREKDLKSWDRKISMVKFVEKHRKFFIWLIILLIGAFQRGVSSGMLVFFMLWLAFVIGFPIICYALKDRPKKEFYPIANMLLKKKEALADEPLIDGRDMHALDDFEEKQEKLKVLQTEQKTLLDELSKVSKLDTRELMIYRAR